MVFTTNRVSHIRTTAVSRFSRRNRHCLPPSTVPPAPIHADEPSNGGPIVRTDRPTASPKRAKFAHLPKLGQCAACRLSITTHTELWCTGFTLRRDRVLCKRVRSSTSIRPAAGPLPRVCLRPHSHRRQTRRAPCPARLFSSRAAASTLHCSAGATRDAPPSASCCLSRGETDSALLAWLFITFTLFLVGPLCISHQHWLWWTGNYLRYLTDC